MGLLSARSFLSGAACTTPKNMIEYDSPFVGQLSFWHFNMILSGASTAIVIVMMVGLMWEHACHMSNPREQLKIMRICHMLPSYAILSFVPICFPNSFVYVDRWTEVWQAVALYAFFLLLVEFLAPTAEEKFTFFGALKVKKAFRKGKYREGTSFLKLTYYMVMQYPIVVWICAIAQCVTQALNRYCLDSDSPKYGHIWIEAISNISVTFAINAILRFYQHTKDYMKERHPLRKLLAFKLMVGLIFVESVAFMILESTDLLHQTSSISYADIHIGLPNMIICVQMVPFSFLIRWAYSTKDYKLNNNVKLANESSEAGESGQLMAETNRQRSKSFQTSYQGGRFGLHAWATYLNPFDMAQDSMNLSKLLRPVHVRKQTLDSWPEPEQDSLKLDDANDTTQESHSMSNYQPVPTTQPEWRPSEDAMQHPQPTAQYGQPGAYYEQPSQFNINTGYSYSSTGYDHPNAENGQRYYS